MARVVGQLVGLSYPFRKEKGQFPKKEIDADVVKKNLILLFRTPLRTRVMRPNFGTNIFRLIFEPADSVLRARLDRSVRQAVVLHEPRAKVSSVNVTIDETAIRIDVKYNCQGREGSFSMAFDSIAA